MAASKRSGDAPPAVTSTKVPRSGRARRALSKAGLIEGQDPLDPFGHVLRREGRAGDVADVLVDGDRIAAGLAAELVQPAMAGDLAAVRLAVLEHLDRLDPAVRLEGHAVVDDEEAQEAPRPYRLPYLLAACAHALSGEPLDGGDVGGPKDDVGLDKLGRLREGQPLRLFHGEVAIGIGRRRRREDDGGWRDQPAPIHRGPSWHQLK